jgi:hypothetical protein
MYTLIPDKHSDTRIKMINVTHFRIKPLALTNDHGRCIAVAPERKLASLGKFPLNVKYIAVKLLAVSLPKMPCNGRFTSETATWIQKWLKKFVGTSRKFYAQ